jgi:carboxymethylenebutenolidase
MDFTLPSGTRAYAATVDSPERNLVLIPDIWGLRPLFTEMCDSISEQQHWNVAAFEPFPGQDLAGAEDPDGMVQRSEALTRLEDAALLGDARAAGEHLGGAPCAVFGFCMGGMYAYKAAAVDLFDRVVGFYGMIRVPEAWEGPGQGQPLDAVRSGPASTMAIIGTVDVWTPPADVEELEAAGATVVRYEGADHGFVHDPSRPTHRPEDAADAWRRAISFLQGEAPA